jgi:hypothetical protein
VSVAIYLSEIPSGTFLVSPATFQSGIASWRAAIFCPNCRPRCPRRLPRLAITIGSEDAGPHFYLLAIRRKLTMAQLMTEHDRTHVTSAGTRDALSRRTHRRLCRCGSTGAASARYPAAFQAQYSGQHRLRDRYVAGPALPSAALAAIGLQQLKCVVFIRDNLFESGNFLGMWSC